MALFRRMKMEMEIRAGWLMQPPTCRRGGGGVCGRAGLGGGVGGGDGAGGGRVEGRNGGRRRGRELQLVVGDAIGHLVCAPKRTTSSQEGAAMVAVSEGCSFWRLCAERQQGGRKQSGGSCMCSRVRACKMPATGHDVAAACMWLVLHCTHSSWSLASLPASRRGPGRWRAGSCRAWCGS